MRRLSLAHVLAAAAPALLVVTFLVGSAPDEEEFRWGILSSFLHARALAGGTLLSWTSTLGLGLPQPMVPNFNLHPLMPLLAAVSPVTWVRLMYAAHTVVGAAGVWSLCRTLEVTPVVRAVAVLTYLLATPTQNYALTDLWLSHYVMWTMGPWLLLLAWRLLSTTGRDAARAALLLGLSAGVALATTHPGHVPVYGTIVVAVGAARYRAIRVRWRWIALAAVITLVIASPNLLHLASEGDRFNRDLGLVKFREPLPLSSASGVFFKPLSHLWDPPGTPSSEARGVFFGGPFAALCLAGLVWRWRTHLDLALGVAISAVLLFTPLLPLAVVSRYHFRDPMLLSAIPLAAVTAEALRRSPRGWLPVIVLLAAQCGAVVGEAIPFLRLVWGAASQQVTTAQGATADTPLVDRLLSAMTEPGRVAYAPQVEFEVSERGRLRQGFGVNALAFRGISIVNGSYKSLSTDELWPDERFYYGRIRIPAPLVESKEGLDLLGVRYLLAKRGEAVARGLRDIAPLTTDGELLLYENPDAWPGAFLTDTRPEELPELPVYSDCSNDRLLCRDLAPLARLRTAGPAAVARREGQIEVTLDGAPADRLLIVVEMFRPAWAASGDRGPLPVVSVGPGLIGVLVPGGTSTIRLEHRSALLTAATLASWSAAAAALVALLLLSRR